MAGKSARDQTASEQAKEAAKRSPARPYPPLSIKSASRLAQAIRDNNAGKPINRLLLAQALNLSPGSVEFRDLIAASTKYGFTKGNYNSEKIELEELGERLTKPRSYEEQLEAMREGIRKIPIFDQLLDHFSNSKLPASEFLKNTIERAPFNVAAQWAGDVAGLFMTNGQEVGYVRNIAGSPWVILEAGPPTEEVGSATPAPVTPATPASDARKPEHATAGTQATHVENQPIAVAQPQPQASVRPAPVAIPAEQPAPKPVQFFIAHGWDKDALQQVKEILGKFKIPFVVAQDEPNAGRPISQKVRELMKSCSAGIFIFSADEEFTTKDGKTIWRPRENVIYELGAGLLEYGNRIVVFKEEKVDFPTDYSDLGRIEYQKGNLRAKAMDLLSELIGLDAVRITAGS